MEASIESLQRFAAQKKSSLTAKKCALLLQRRAVLTISVCKQQTSEGVDLRISSHHSSLSTSEETSSTFAR